MFLVEIEIYECPYTTIRQSTTQCYLYNILENTDHRFPNFYLVKNILR